MKAAWLMISVSALLSGCAERDNPFDHASTPGPTPVPSNVRPIPHQFNIVVDVQNPDVECLKIENYPEYKCVYGQIPTAISIANPGDTIWVVSSGVIRLSGLLDVIRGGSKYLPIVIRSFDGPLEIQAPVDNGKYIDCMKIRQAYIKIQGFKFRNCRTGIISSGLDGDISLDSVAIENSEQAIDFQQIHGTVSLRNISLTNIFNPPALTFNAIDNLDTSGGIHWTK